MSNEYQNPIDALYDEENSDPITLFNEKGEEMVFEQIALIPIKEKVYAILKPIQPIDGLGEDEGLVFSIEILEVDGLEQEGLVLVTDDNTLDEVFNVYYQLLDAN